MFGLAKLLDKKRELGSQNKIISYSSQESVGQKREQLLDFLCELEELEAQLWGVTLKEIEHEEENVVEDTNHFIYVLIHNSEENVKKVLEKKGFSEFKKHVLELRQSLAVLIKKVRKRRLLTHYISEFTIVLSDPSIFDKLEKIFLLEKQLYDVLRHQEDDFEIFINEIKKMKIEEKDQKKDLLLEKLKDIRAILSGHLDHHDLWEDERQGYSNTSNIIYSLKKVVNEL